MKKHISLTDFYDNGEPIVSVPDHDIVQLSYSNLSSYIVNAFHTRYSFLIYGDAGLGKSEIVRGTAKKLAEKHNRVFIDWQAADLAMKQELINNSKKYFVFIDIRTAQLEPADLSGIPNIQSQEKFLEMLPQKWVYLMSMKNSMGMLFLDELNQGSTQVLKAMFQVILDRGVGNLKFADDWGIIAAGNLGTLFQNDPIPPALTNRFLIGKLVADAASWIDWANHNDVDEIITSFVESSPTDNFYSPPKEATSNPFPTPRQFVALSKQMDFIKEQYGNTDIKHPQSIYKTIGDTAAQLCGVNWGQRFLSFIRYQKTYNWETISKDPEKYINDKVNPDVKHAMIIVIRDAVIKMFADSDESAATKKQQLKFAELYVKVFTCFDKEYQLILFNRLNMRANQQQADLLAMIFLNQSVPAFKEVAKEFNKLVKMSRGEV